MNKLMSATSILLLAITVGAQQEVPPIRNFMRVNEQFCTGGQPRLEHLQKLKSEGVRAIINLRPTGEHRAAEEEVRAKELGLRYFNIPVVFGEPKEEQATEFLRVTDDPDNRPAFIHCASAIRVGAFWMIRRVLRDGWSTAAAEEEAKKIGLRESPHLNEFARSYIAQHRDKASSTAERELIELERELSDALIKGDSARLTHLWSDNLVFTFPDGKTSTKAQRLAGIKPSAQPTQATPAANSNDEVKVHLHGNTAVVTVLSTWKGKANNQEFSQQYQATHVWVKQEERWQLVAAHVSQVKK